MDSFEYVRKFLCELVDFENSVEMREKVREVDRALRGEVASRQARDIAAMVFKMKDLMKDKGW